MVRHDEPIAVQHGDSATQERGAKELAGQAEGGCRAKIDSVAIEGSAVRGALLHGRDERAK